MNSSRFLRENYHVAVGIAIAYVITIFGLQRYMRDREPVKFNKLQATWNFLLGLFSIAGSVVVVPLLYNVIVSKGVDGELCGPETEVRTVWVYYFCVSKVPELVDTLFIVLRKSRLRLLQWYHHVATMLYAWHSWSLLISNGAAFAGMNLLVHSVMYPYFGMATLGYRAGAPVRVFITTLQLTQMVFGVWLTYRAMLVCPDQARWDNLIWALVMYASYFLLFLKLFLDSYVFAAVDTRSAKTNGSGRRGPVTRSKKQD